MVCLLCLLIVALFGFVVLRGISNLMRTTDLFVVVAATGLLVQFALQALINMGSTTSLMPTKGMTLPFVSYGGSSLLALAFGMGILLALTRRRAGGLRGWGRAIWCDHHQRRNTTAQWGDATRLLINPDRPAIVVI